MKKQTHEEIIEWLMEGDPSIRCQTMRDLTDTDEKKLALERKKIARVGWGTKLLSLQDSSGTWGGREQGLEFLLAHKLFRSHRTGKIVDNRMIRFSFPPRWRYDILRALDYSQENKAPRDSRFEEAIQIVKRKQTKEGPWKLQNRHPGRTFFELEQVGKPSRWNTLRALRILRWWNK